MLEIYELRAGRRGNFEVRIQAPCEASASLGRCGKHGVPGKYVKMQFRAFSMLAFWLLIGQTVRV